MPRQKAGDKLEAAIKAKAALDAEIRALQAQARDKKREEDERRFVVAGRAVTAHIAGDLDGRLSRDIIALLDRALTRPADRRLFAFLDAGAGMPPPGQGDGAAAAAEPAA